MHITTFLFTASLLSLAQSAPTPRSVDLSTLTTIIKQEYQAVRGLCIAETQVIGGVLNALESGKMSAKQAACFNGCILDKLGIINADGSLNYAGLNEKLDNIEDEVQQEQGEILAGQLTTALSGVKDICEAGEILGSVVPTD